MKVSVKDICSSLEEIAPLELQEDFDNAGLLVGNPSSEVSQVLLCIDVTEEVIDEAIAQQCNMIVSHHPLIFRGMKSLTGRNYVERCVIKAIQHNIAIYASHTNLDVAPQGVNHRIAEKIGLQNIQVLQPREGALSKLVVFVPTDAAEQVRQAIFEAGSGHIGNYDSCSFSSQGVGSFRGNGQSIPYVGSKNEIHAENEIRIEVILPSYLKSKVSEALIKAHPYEEPAFDFIALDNNWQQVGLGIIGELPQPENEAPFLQRIKEIFQISTLRHTEMLDREIKRVALCGGSGAEFVGLAVAHAADVYLSADFKYHDFFLPNKNILLADIGHFESEQYTKEIFYEQIIKKIPKFAIRFSEVNTNPIKYL